jgi:IS30 family transposase
MAQYNHLTKEDRYYIQIEYARGTSITEIGKNLNRPKSTISRELRRNTDNSGYCFNVAQNLATLRHSMKKKATKWTEQMAWQVTEYLLKQFSPDQIVNKMKSQEKPCVSAESIYQFVRIDKKSGGKLWSNLRHASASYERGKSKKYKGKIPDRIDISERPSIVDEKSRVGDWEADTMIGKGHQGVFVTLTERVTKLNLAIVVPSKEASVVKDAIIKALSPLKEWVHTITFDNGLEFTQHSKVAGNLDCQTFFAKPYSSWQRGLNENHNGLLRQYFPKNMPLNEVTQDELDFAINALNDRPRKKLGYKTPREVFTQMTGLTF